MAKPTKFIAACRRIEAAIERATSSGTGSHKTRAAMRRELAYWTSTYHSSDSFPRLYKLKLPWRQWDRELYIPAALAGATLHMMAREGFSKAKALSFSRAASSDVDYVLALLKETGLSLHHIVAEQSDVLGTEIAASLDALSVRLESRALEDILLAAAESYRVSPRKSHKYTEVFGLCFGSVRRDGIRRESRDVRVNVGRVVTQLRAKATPDSVMPNSQSLVAHLDVGNQFFPHLELVGDYHTHPYDSLSDLVANQGWEYSAADLESLPGYMEEVRARRERPLFSLVVAVAEGGKTGKGAFRKRPNVVQVPVGNLYFIIGAYRIRLDASYDQQVDLSLPALIK